MKHWIGITLFVAAVFGFGIKASVKCGEATWVDSYTIVVLAHNLIPDFDLCSM